MRGPGPADRGQEHREHPLQAQAPGQPRHPRRDRTRVVHPATPIARPAALQPGHLTQPRRRKGHQPAKRPLTITVRAAPAPPSSTRATAQGSRRSHRSTTTGARQRSVRRACTAGRRSAPEAGSPQNTALARQLGSQLHSAATQAVLNACAVTLRRVVKFCKDLNGTGLHRSSHAPTAHLPRADARGHERTSHDFTEALRTPVNGHEPFPRAPGLPSKALRALHFARIPPADLAPPAPDRAGRHAGFQPPGQPELASPVLAGASMAARAPRGPEKKPVHWLLGVSPGPTHGRRVPVSRDRFLVGRAATSDLMLGDPRVSRVHAALQQRGDELYVEDLGSTSGTAINGIPVTAPRRLRHGDVVTFATVQLRYEKSDQPRDQRIGRTTEQPALYSPSAEMAGDVGRDQINSTPRTHADPRGPGLPER